jgi:2-polyprenyl-3-methyl-5-hydroxy-6-metoxy-1,4-benzoquinol methylase
VAGGNDDWIELNRLAWDERVPLHVDSSFYDNETFVAGRSSLRSFEIDEVGAVDGKTLLHLQCHFGQDTLSWARSGARVTGLDFSVAAVSAARRLADEMGIEAEFVVANVYDASEALPGRTFDVVYTGLGALIWLPDITRWARLCASLIAPGGFLYLAEFHPIVDVFDDDELAVVEPYFRPEGHLWQTPGSYVDPAAPTEHNATWEWTHPVGEVVTAIVEAGLQLEFLHEHPMTLWQRFPFLERRGDGTFHLPAERPSLPMLYSLRARKPH